MPFLMHINIGAMNQLDRQKTAVWFVIDLPSSSYEPISLLGDLIDIKFPEPKSESIYTSPTSYRFKYRCALADLYEYQTYGWRKIDKIQHELLALRAKDIHPDFNIQVFAHHNHHDTAMPLISNKDQIEYLSQKIDELAQGLLN